MEYVDADGQKKTPYIIHRTSMGCYERTLAYLIELYAGALPLWMSPEQVRILTITDRAEAWADEVAKELNAIGLRVSVDKRNEKIGFKVREAQLEKTPYMVVLGDQEVENKQIALRDRKGKNYGVMSLADFKAKLLTEVAEKSREV